MASDAAPLAGPAPQPDLLDTSDAGPAAVRGGVLRTGGYVVGVLLSVGSAALLFRHLGVDDAGRYVTALSLVTIAGGLSDLGLTAVAIRELTVRDPAGRDHFIRNLLGLRTALTSLGVIGVMIFCVATGFPAVVVAGTALGGIGLIIANLQGTLSAGLTVQLRLGWVTVAELARQIVTVFGIVILVVAGASLLPFLALQIPAALAGFIVTAWLVWRDTPVRPAFDWPEWKAVLREVLPFAAASMLGVIYFRLAIVLLSMVSTEAQTGYFSASFRMIEVLVAIPSILVSGAFPIFARAARDDHARLGYGVQRTFEASLAVGAGVGLLLILGAPFAIAVVAGPDFKPSVGILRIQAIALVAIFVYVTWAYALLSLRRYRAILLLSISGVALGAAAVLILGSLHGAKGAAWATTGVDLFQCVLVGIALGMASREVRPSLARVPRVALAVAVAAGVALLIPVDASVVKAAVGGIVYAVLAVVLHAAPDELVVEARAAVARFKRR